MECALSGYRHIPICLPTGELIESCTIFVHIEFTDQIGKLFNSRIVGEDGRAIRDSTDELIMKHVEKHDDLPTDEKDDTLKNDKKEKEKEKDETIKSGKPRDSMKEKEKEKEKDETIKSGKSRDSIKQYFFYLQKKKKKKKVIQKGRKKN